MTPEQRELAKQYLQRWKWLGPELQQFEREELAALSEERRLSSIDPLLRMAYDFRSDRETSGLVEQQRLFHREQRS